MRNFTPEITDYISRLKSTLDALNKDEINTFIKLLVKARDEDRLIFIMGNGGSAATASHFCCDFNKGASYGYDKRFRFMCLNDNMATLMAYANDVGYADALVEQLKNFFRTGDYVIGISGSGNSVNVIRAVEFANANGGVTIGLTGYNGGKLRQICRYSVNMGIDDMQISEDLHMMLNHLVLRVLNQTQW